MKDASIGQRNMENDICLYELLTMGNVLILKIKIISAVCCSASSLRRVNKYITLKQMLNRKYLQENYREFDVYMYIL
jgi:hypothetical protein